MSNESEPSARNAHPDGTPKRGGWMQFSLYTLLMLTLIAAGAFKWYSRPEIVETEYIGGSIKIVAQIRHEQHNGWWLLQAEAGQQLVRGHYLGDQPVGKWDAWHRNGHPLFQGQLAGGKASGTWQVFFPDGRRQMQLEMQDARPNGPARAWHPNGQPHWQGQFADGHPAGTWTFWDGEGHKTQRDMSDPPIDDKPPFVELTEDQVATLVAQLTGKSLGQRSDAARVLCVGGAKVARPVAAGLSHEDPTIRATCAWVLYRLGPHAAGVTAELTRAVDDEQFSVALHAARALGMIGPQSAAAFPKIEQRAPRGPIIDRLPWLCAMIRIRPRSPALSELLDHLVARRIDAWYVQAVLNLAGDEAVPILLEKLDSPEAQQRLAVFDVLVAVGKPAEAALPRLMEVVKSDPDMEVRNAAARTVESIRASMFVAPYLSSDDAFSVGFF